MNYRVLGPLLLHGGNGVLNVRAAKQKRLLAILLINANRSISVDALIDTLWTDDPPSGAVSALRYHVSKLRDTLAPGRSNAQGGDLETTPTGYRLQVDPDQFDSSRFEHLAHDGARLLRDGQGDAARFRLRSALDLWRGSAYEDFLYESFAQSEIARLEEDRLLCLEDRIEADLAVGDHREVLGELRDLTTRFPLRERFWSQLMVALYRSDQQAEALAAYQSARRVLGDELGIEPSESLRDLEEQILLHDLPFQPEAAERPVLHNLPARVQSLVGRAAEIESVVTNLDAHRLVTVTGFGGVGKTTVAVEAGRRIAGLFEDGAWMLELAPLTGLGEIIDQAVTTLGLSPHLGRDPLAGLVAGLGAREMLLILDNCEHVAADAARLVQELLERCPGVRVLTTSRKPLGIVGEHVYVVPPLAVPGPSSDRGPSQAESVTLFLDRAASVQSEVESRPVDAAVIDEICRRLEGVPLALELAAARLRVLSPRQLLERLDARLGTLGGGTPSMPERHRSIRTVIEWSHSLLEPPDQVLFRRLAVFAGPPTLEAIEQICAGNGIDQGDLLDLIGALVDASLLAVRDTDPRRYGMLALVRDYALEQLRSSGEETELRQRHAEFYASIYDSLPALDSPEFDSRLTRLSGDAAEARAALAWTVEQGDGERAVTLAANLELHSAYSTPNSDALTLFDRVLELTRGTVSAERSRLLGRVGLMHVDSGRFDAARAIVDEFREIRATTSDTSTYASGVYLEGNYLDALGARDDAHRLAAHAADHLEALGSPDAADFLAALASKRIRSGDEPGGESELRRLEDLAGALNLPMIAVWVTVLRGEAAWYRGDIQEAYLLLTQTLAANRQLGREGVALSSLLPLGEVCLAAGRLDEAIGHAQRAVENTRRSGLPGGMCRALRLLARTQSRSGDLGAATAAAGEALSLAEDWPDEDGRWPLLFSIAQIARAKGDWRSSVALHAGSAARLASIGEVLPKPLEGEKKSDLDAARSALGDVAFEEAWALGRAEAWESLVERARHVLRPELQIDIDLSDEAAMRP